MIFPSRIEEPGEQYLLKKTDSPFTQAKDLMMLT